MQLVPSFVLCYTGMCRCAGNAGNQFVLPFITANIENTDFFTAFIRQKLMTEGNKSHHHFYILLHQRGDCSSRAMPPVGMDPWQCWAWSWYKTVTQKRGIKTQPHCSDEAASARAVEYIPFRGHLFPFRGHFLPFRGHFLPFGDHFFLSSDILAWSPCRKTPFPFNRIFRMLPNLQPPLLQQWLLKDQFRAPGLCPRLIRVCF